MSNQIRFRCPGCQATLQVPGEMRGKQMACPKCQKRFRLPEPKVVVAQPIRAAQPEADPFASFPSAPQWGDITSGDLTGTSSGGGFPNQPAYGNSSNFDNPGFSAASSSSPGAGSPPSSSSYAQTYAGYSPPKPKLASKKRSDSPDLSEADANTQSSGIFLLLIPVLAAILPMFGLQLRRLARAGEYAPLGAMFLGFIGAALIIYARRKRSDAIPCGAAAVAFTLVFGVGGFLLQSWSNPDAAPVQQTQDNSGIPGQPMMSGTTEVQSAEEINERNAQIKARHDQLRAEHDQIMADMQAEAQAQLEDSRRQAEEFRNQSGFGGPGAPGMSGTGGPPPSYGPPPGFGKPPAGGGPGGSPGRL